MWEKLGNYRLKISSTDFGEEDQHEERWPGSLGVRGMSGGRRDFSVSVAILRQRRSNYMPRISPSGVENMKAEPEISINDRTEQLTLAPV